MIEPRDPVDRLLKAELRATGGDALPPATSACVDAETFAAWADGALPQQQTSAIELHLADCERCQALMAAFAQTEPAVAAVAAPARQPWFLRWAMPLAAAAAVTTLAVWLTRSPTPTTPVTPPVSTMAEADAKKQEPAPLPPAPAQGQLGRLEDRNSKLSADRDRAAMSQLTKNDKDQKAKEEFAKRAQANEAKTRADAQPAAPPALPVAGAAGAPARQVPMAAPTTPPVALQPPPPPATAPPPTQPDFSRTIAGNPTFRSAVAADELRPAGAIVAEFSSSAFQQDRVAQGGAGGVSGARGGGGGGGGRGGGAASSATVAGAIDPAATTPRRWRVYASGGVGRSTDGAIWEPVTIDPPAHITAGVAPSPLVCWLAGRNGAVFISIDGSRFTKLVFPDAVDLTSVRATNAREATVTTADGRTFVTSDGGISWTIR